MPAIISTSTPEDSIASSPLPTDDDALESIAVVGMGLKFPQDADTPETFWKLLLDGRSAMTEVPKDRWNIDSFYHPNSDRHDTMSARGGHFLKEDITLFDAPFFSLPPAEAACMDPQQRSLLECTYHAFENSGIPMNDVIGSRTSCFVGSFSREFDPIMNRDPQLDAKYTATGTGSSMLSNRLSWFYDLKGASLSLDTACSSSLVALDLAVQSLRRGDSEMSLVAGCNLMLNPDTNYIPLSNLGFLGTDSVCYSFDHRANGYARGEGTAVIVLKPLKNALRDNDTIRAVIRNTGSNQDGRTPGITQPSREAQAALIKETYRRAELSLSETGFFEAHGTGTPIGDPREAGAIADVFKDHRTEPLVIGAVKTNIGHLEGASGLAGLIKSIFILEKGIIPRNIWFEKLNPDIPAEEWKLLFPTTTMSWPQRGLRRASVNSFGYGGSNAHVILDDAYHYLEQRDLNGRHRTVKDPPSLRDSNSLVSSEKTAEENRHRLFIWSASDEGGIKRLADRYEDRLPEVGQEPQSYLQDLAYTLSQRRTNMPWKSFLVGDSVAEVRNALASGLLSRPIRSSAGVNPTVAFVFTGQGAQWYGMGKELSIYPTFMKSLQNAEKYLSFLGCSWKVTDFMSAQDDQLAAMIDDPAVAQPLCTVLQIALVDLLAEWNISPSAVVGHSSGEIAAAYCARSISRESAYRIAYFRGEFSSKLAHTQKDRAGSMIAVALGQEGVQPYLDRIDAEMGQGRLVIGCVNSPKNVTLSGDGDCVDMVKTLIDKDQIFCRKLKVPVAYHSKSMEESAAGYQASIQDIIPRDDALMETLPVVFSSVTGSLISPDELSSPAYWVRNMVSQVKFSPAVQVLCETLQGQAPDGEKLCLVEVGPHGALQRPVKEILETTPAANQVVYYAAQAANQDALKSLLTLVGNLHCHGYNCDLLSPNALGQEEFDAQLLVDLPQYPFNHTQGHWLEGRLSHNYRFNAVPRHELLGARAMDWNPLEPQWRNIIRMSELPWIKEHCFNGSELYPAAGIMVMAIEAARQMADPTREISGYSLQDVVLEKALLVDLTSEGTETRVHLRPQKQQSTPDSDCHAFQLYQVGSEGWSEVSRATIVTQYKGQASGPREDTRLREQWEHGVGRCTRTVDSMDVYANLHSYGFEYGPSFQCLENVHYNPDRLEAAATLDPRRWISKVPNSEWALDHVIHPTTLDAFMQLSAVGESGGTWNPLRTMVPSRIDRLWISQDLLSHTPEQRLHIFAEPTFRGYRDTVVTAIAYDTRTDECQIAIEGYRATAITSLEPPAVPRIIGFDMDWKADHSLLTDDQLADVCCEGVTPQDKPDPAEIDQVELACLFYTKQAIEELNGWLGDTHHITKYIEWMKMEVYRYEAASKSLTEERPSLTDRDYFQRLLPQISPSPEMDLINEVGKNLASILRGEIDALEVLFGEDNMAQHFYGGKTFLSSNKKAATYIDLLAHKDPTIKILEIGAGTGGSSAFIMDRLARRADGKIGQMRCGEYTYTDISPAFFEAAANRFEDYLPRMDFKVLDIEKDPEAQGFEPEKYDVVVASAVLHATTNLSDTLRNVHTLMKPNAKLVLIEPCNLRSLRIPLIFGLLPGWWLSCERTRYWGPLLSPDGWIDTLQEAGFNGANISSPDFEDHRHTMSMIISTAIKKPEPVPEMPFKQALILVADPQSLQHPLVGDMEAVVGDLGVETRVVVYEDLAEIEVNDALCISLLEVERGLLANIRNEDWRRLKTLVRSAWGMIWITRGRDDDPTMGMVTGLKRGIASETPQFNFIDLALQPDEDWRKAALHTQHIITGSLRSRDISTNEIETEYEERGGTLHINRVTEANYFNQHIASKVDVQGPQQRALTYKKEAKPLSLTIRNPGLLATLAFQEQEMSSDELAPGEIEIQTKAVGISFKDCKIALGQIPANSLGTEFSGVVVQVGPGIPSDLLKPWDRVYGLAPNAFTTKIRTKASAVTKIPDGMSFATAASIPLSFAIAYHALVNLARLQTGDSVLIHSGAGGVGQAAIQIARARGAEVYTTVGSEEKQQLLTRLYGVPSDRILVGRGTSSLQQLDQVVDGVDVVLNSWVGDGLRRSLACLRPFGRFIDISTGDKKALEDLPNILMTQNITYSTFDLSLALEQPTSLVRGLMTSVDQLISTSQIQAPGPINRFPTSSVEDAFRCVQEGKTGGKVVVEMKEGEPLSVIPSTAANSKLREDASYVIVGGLGGLGKSTTRWMADRGAKYLILLSRSGAKTAAAKAFIDEITARGVTVAAPSCDITDFQSLSSTLEVCAQTMPPVRGCIQGAMVVRDDLFEPMTIDDFHATVQPKVAGSWNLHRALPEELDFFVLLASAGGIIGTRGQTNYCSGNTYQDVLARYRTSRGLKAMSLDLGLVIGIGFAAENRETLQQIHKLGYRGIREGEYLAMLDYLCNADLPIPQDPRKAQVITGLEIPEYLRSNTDSREKQNAQEWMRWVPRPQFRNLASLVDYDTSRSTDTTAAASQGADMAFQKEFVEALSTDDLSTAARVVASALKHKLANTLRIPEEDIETQKPIHTYGIDSLVAVELRYWVSKEFRSDLSIFEIMAETSMGELCQLVTAKSQFGQS